MRFRPVPGQAQQILLPTSLTALVIAALLLWFAATAPVGIGTFVLLVLALGLAVLGLLILAHALSLRALEYHLDRNGIVIDAGVWQVSLPMEAIDGVYSAPAESAGTAFRGLRLPGHNVGLGKMAGNLDLVSIATAPPEECLYVRAGSTVYALSPAEPDVFRRTYSRERSLGALRVLPLGLQLPPLLRSLFWQDRLGRTLTAVAVASALALLALTFSVYPTLPDNVAMHFDAQGLPDRIASARSIFYLPSVGIVVLVVNSALGAWVYRSEPVLSYFLWSGATLVQIMLILALRTIAG